MVDFSPLSWISSWGDALVGPNPLPTTAYVIEPSESHTLLGLPGCAGWEGGGSESEGALPSRRSSLWSLPAVTGRGVPTPAQNQAGS